jgi:hypothetical protein
MRSLWIFLFLLIAGCDPQETKEERTSVDPVPAPTTTATDGAAIQFPQIDDNITNDTLLIQTTFDLGDGTFLMVASHSQTEERLDAGDRNAGLRLYHYKLEEGTPVILATSTPALDSWTMFPTFFKDPLQPEGYIILANFGARDSWGQKVIRFNKDGLEDLGFLKIALVERVKEEAEEQVRQRNIAPHTVILPEANGWSINFSAAEVMLFDDLRGGTDVIMPGSAVSYHWEPTKGITLIVNGEERLEEKAS